MDSGRRPSNRRHANANCAALTVVGARAPHLALPLQSQSRSQSQSSAVPRTTAIAALCSAPSNQTPDFPPAGRSSPAPRAPADQQMLCAVHDPQLNLLHQQFAVAVCHQPHGDRFNTPSGETYTRFAPARAGSSGFQNAAYAALVFGDAPCCPPRPEPPLPQIRVSARHAVAKRKNGAASRSFASPRYEDLRLLALGRDDQRHINHDSSGPKPLSYWNRVTSTAASRLQRLLHVAPCRGILCLLPAHAAERFISACSSVLASVASWSSCALMICLIPRSGLHQCRHLRPVARKLVQHRPRPADRRWPHRCAHGCRARGDEALLLEQPIVHLPASSGIWS